MSRVTLRWTVLALGLTVLTAPPVFAQAHAGIRAGVSGDPDQFFFGGHIETTPILDHLTFRPNVEVGAGDGLTLIALNLEFAYRIPIKRNPWWVYLGAGPTANIFSGETRRAHRESTVGGGFNILIGLQHRQGLFAEFKVGAIDSPSVKFTIGYAFK